MAINLRAVKLQAPATNTTQDYTISGFGTAQAVIVWAGVANDGSDANGVYQSFGFWDGTNARSLSANSRHGITAATAHAADDESDSDVVNIYDQSAGVRRTATISAVTDGIRLTWAGSDTSYRPWVIVTLINGVNGAVVGGLTPSNTDAGTATASSLGITPKAIFGIQNRRNFGDGPVAWRGISFGFAYDNGSGIDQRAMTWHSRDNSTDIRMIMSDDRITEEYGSSSVDTGQEITDMSSGEFTSTSRGAGAADHDLGYLALDFDEDAAVFTSTLPTTDVAWTPLSGGSFIPDSTIMLVSNCTSLNSQMTDNGAGFFGLYVANDTEEFEIGWAEEDAADPTNNSGRTEDLLFSQDHNAGTPHFTATSPAFSSGQIQYSSANAGEADRAAYVFGIAFASASGVVNTKTLTSTINVYDGSPINA